MMEHIEKSISQCVQSSFDLIRLLDGSHYRLVEGILHPDQSALLFETDEISPQDPRRCKIKVVIEKNRWKLETEIR